MLPSISLVPSEPAPQLVGESISWTAATADFGPAPVYQFRVGPEHGPLRVVRDFSLNSSFTWTPMEEGTYDIQVIAKQGFNATDTESADALDVVNSRVTGTDAVITPTSNPLVALFSVPPTLPGPGPHGTVHVEFAVAGDNPSWRSTNELPSEPGKSTNFLVAGMLPNTTYEMRDVFSDGTASVPQFFMTGSLPSNLVFPSFTVQQPPGSGSDLDQDMLFHQLGVVPNNFANPLATDLNGRVVWYYDLSHSGFTRSFPGQSLVPGGTVLLLGSDKYAAKSGGTLDVVREIDLAGDVLRETNIDAVNAQLTALGFHSLFSFTHDVQRLPNGATAVIGSTERTIDINGTPTEYVGMTIVILDKDFQVAWAWDAFDHLDVNRGPVLGEVLHAGDPDQIAASTPIFPAVDWLHINAVSWSPADGNLVVSVRHQDWVLKIDYENGAGDGHVIWRLGQGGDFTVNSSDPNPWFSHQHNAHYINDSTIILFDNGNTRHASDPNAHSRGQVWKLDEQTMTATLLVNVDLGNYSDHFGGAQRLSDGNYVFTSGAQGSPPNVFGQSIEVGPDGTPAYVLKVNKPEFRSFRLRTLYEGISDQLKVVNNADSGPGSLRDTIAAAISGDQIVFDPSLKGQTITLTSGELAIDKSLDIEGLGADQLTISGNGAGRVFDLTGSGANVTIAGLTIANGLAAQGGGIENLADNLTLSGVKLSNDQAVGAAGENAEGGGLYNGSPATLGVRDSVFANDLARGGDGVSGGNAGTAYGGALFNQGVATLDGSMLSANQALGGNSTGVGGSGYGGGIMNDVGGMLTVRDSAFLGNQAIGGVHGKLDPAPAFIEDVGDGAAINNAAVLGVSDCTFAGNQSQGGPGLNGVAGGGGASGAIKSGGEDVDPPSQATVTDCAFLDNRAIGGAGGAGAVGGQGTGAAFLADHGTDTLSGCTFLGNEAIGGAAGLGGGGGLGEGGAIANVQIFSLPNTSTLTLRDCVLADNEAVGGAGATGGVGRGGAISNAGGPTLAAGGISTIIIDSLSSGNVAEGGDGSAGNGGNGLGGGLFTDKTAVLTVTGGTVTGNQAQGGAGAAGFSNGKGQGGGLFVAPGGSACADIATVIDGNSASTSNDEVFGVLGSC